MGGQKQVSPIKDDIHWFLHAITCIMPWQEPRSAIFNRGAILFVHPLYEKIDTHLSMSKARFKRVLSHAPNLIDLDATLERQLVSVDSHVEPTPKCVALIQLT